jgi:hypothetical protein
MEREQLALIGLARSNEVLRVCVELLLVRRGTAPIGLGPLYLPSVTKGEFS